MYSVCSVVLKVSNRGISDKKGKAAVSSRLPKVSSFARWYVASSYLMKRTEPEGAPFFSMNRPESRMIEKDSV